MKKILSVLSFCILAAGCGGRAGSQEAEGFRDFPQPEIPSVITDIEERKEYLARHYWDGFLGGEGVTDSSHVLGVIDGDVEQSLSNYIEFLGILPMDQAESAMRQLFGSIENRQSRDTSSLFFMRMTEIVSRYLYDPNSPMRNEDYYLPFVEGLAVSPYTSEDRRRGYAFEKEMCSMNRYGEVVPDFKFKDIRGKVHSLHGVKAGYTMLFFSNPGCQSCKDIIDQIGTRPYVDDLIADGSLAIVNVYIDGEVDKWKAYAPIYPENWLNGYDYDQLVNTGQLYYVRAIPSLYLLDSEKRVIFKDAPVERVLNFLDNLINN